MSLCAGIPRAGVKGVNCAKTLVEINDLFLFVQLLLKSRSEKEAAKEKEEGRNESRQYLHVRKGRVTVYNQRWQKRSK